MIATRRAVTGGLCCTCLSLLFGCMEHPKGLVAPGHRPALDTDEAGLRHMLDRVEADLKTSPSRLSSGSVEPYLRDLAARLAGPHAADIRVYLVHAPYFNASMAPNGMLQIWSGALLRLENEAQLAALIGHEIGHYLEQHTLERWRNLRQTGSVAQFLSLGIAGAGGGALALLPGIAAFGQVMAYSREQELEADAIGLELMARAGLAPAQSAQLWQNVVDEQAAEPSRNEPDLFAASHPAATERRDALRRAVAAELMAGDVGAERYLSQARTIRAALLQDEIGLRQPERSLAVIGRLRRMEPDDGALAFYEGEVYRLRGETADLDRALELYADAAELPGAPPEVWRSLGLVRRRRGAQAPAAEAFNTYLGLRPDAPDAALIRSYLAPGT